MIKSKMDDQVQDGDPIWIIKFKMVNHEGGLKMKIISKMDINNMDRPGK